MRAQRACRRFDPDGKVLDSDIEQMLQSAVHAPSAENTQPWSFVVVRDADSRKLLADWWTETWNAGGGDFIKQSLDDRALVNDLEYGFNRGGFAAALSSSWSVPTPTAFPRSTHRPRSTPPCRTCCSPRPTWATGPATFGVDRVRERLALPDTLLPMAAVYLGLPAKTLSPPRRRPALDVTYREKFGVAW